MNEIQKYNEDYALALGKKGEVLMLLDLSGSMTDYVQEKTKRRHLFDAVKDMKYPAITFGGKPNEYSWRGGREECHLIEAIKPDGGTPMSGALMAARERHPKVTFLVSDGSPNDCPEDDFGLGEFKDPNQWAFENALALGCPVNTIFIGSPGASRWDKEGRELLIAIARATGGYFQEVGVDDLTTDLTTQMEGAFRSMLLLPAKI